MRVSLVFPSLLAILLHILLPSPASAVVLLGATLRPNDQPTPAWSSPNGTFVIRFLPDPRSPSSLFRAAITLAGPNVAVWTAGGAGNRSASVDSAGSLQLLSDGNLRLLNGSGSLVWESGTNGRGVNTAELQESGNLVLRNRTNSPIWQSFENPTDTIVQNQNFTSDQTLRSGSYSFRILSSGNLTLTWNNNVVYYNKNLNSFNSSFNSNSTLASPTLILQPNGILSLNSLTLPSAVIAYSSDYGEGGDANLVRYVRLDDDGNLRAYSLVRGSAGQPETPRWSAVEDQCEVFGWCGNFGVCSYNETQPVCGCPSRNFVLTDPNNPRMGCRRTQEIQDCPGNSTMLELDNTKFLTYAPDLSAELFFVGISACRLNCLSGPSCVASTSLADGSGLCYLKVSNFISGYQSRALPSTSYVKVCAPGIPNPPANAASGSSLGSDSSSKGLRWWIVLIVILGTVSGLVLIEYALWLCFCKGNSKYGVGGGTTSAQYALLEYASGAPVQFSYKELHRSTKGFKERLGAGGFGAVYKGTLQANKTVVAVKQLEGIEQGEKQFRMEVATISSTHHLNLVRLIGFCSEGRHRLLVYEFMKNGSLDNFLFPSTSSDDAVPKPPPPLPWDVRYRIALGTARGITYLHEECRDCIVHCDIKPENILLDDGFNAKVSDFGLAKLVNPKDHRYRTLTSVRGTRGYLAPEWLANLPITSKSDVYSYGMVLLETVSGRRNFDVSEDTGRKKFSVWAYEEYDKGSVRSIVDGRLSVQELDMAQVQRAVQVSFWCIQEQPSQRPTMGKVVQMLEGVMDIERPPAPKAVDASVSITSGSATVSVISTFAPSAQVPSSTTDSFLGGDGGGPVSSTASASRRNGEKTTTTLLD